ncbi:ABC transporter substrate-binding protein [Frankia canadensis]|nr:ABC transporter substrate-binding protein [Frankia canadensis]
MLTVVAITLLGAAACSSGESSADTGSCTAPGVDPSRINLGVIFPDTGAESSFFAGVRAGIDARLGAANAAGGVHGRKITYEWRDDQSDRRRNSIAADSLVGGRNVFGVIETTFGSPGGADALSRANMPVTGVAIEPDWLTHRNMFSFAYTASDPVDTHGRFVRSRGGTRAVIVHTDLSAGASFTAGQYARSLRAAGVQVVDDLSYTAGADTPESFAARVAASDPDAIVSVMNQADFIQILRALRAAGHDPKVILAISGYDQQLLRKSGPAMAGVSVPLFYRPFEAGGPAIGRYLDAMRHFAPQVLEPRQDTAMLSYISADMFVRGLELAGPCPSGQRVIDALHAVTRYDADGLIAPINIRDGYAKPTTCYDYVQVNSAGTAFGPGETRLCGAALTP